MLVAHDDPARAVAVLDWDMCTRGDPLMDLGYLLTYWPEAGDPLTWRDSCPSPLWRHGFPTRAEAVQRYAERSGLDLGHIAWYHAWGTFKIAVVIQQIYIRWRRGQTQDERFAVMGERVRILIDKGCKIAGVSGVSGGIDGDSSSNGTGPAVQ